MSRAFARVLLKSAFLACCVFAASCSKKAKGDSAATAKPGDESCYSTANLAPCPKDTSDPGGQQLPAPGNACSLDECAVCGSKQAPAFRDATGASQPGYCICVARSGGDGSVYSCFTPEQWHYE
jgi:hypothetical protein